MGYYQEVVIAFEKRCESPKACESFLDTVTRKVKTAVIPKVEPLDIERDGNDIKITFRISGTNLYEWERRLGLNPKTCLDIKKFSGEETCTIAFEYFGEETTDTTAFKYKNGTPISEMVEVTIDKYDDRLEHANRFIEDLRKKGLLEEAKEARSIYNEFLAHLALDY
jgi:hypothetical protein